LKAPAAYGAAGSRGPVGPHGVHGIRSADRKRVHQAAFCPECVEAALDLQGAALPDIAFEAFAVVADLLDDVVGPGFVEADIGSSSGRHAQKATHIRAVALTHLVDVRRGDAKLF